MRKRICALAVAIVLALGCAAVAERADFMYAAVGGEAYVTGYIGSDASIVIPDELGGLPVTTVAGGAFLNAAITAATIPASVKYVGDGAFMGCAKLTSVTFEGSVCDFGRMVFEGCASNLSITAPKGSDAQAYARENRVASVDASVSDEELYRAALAALEAGSVSAAQDMFAGLGGYEDSRDYYIYATARAYEENGETDKAVALYALVPGILDATDRAATLSGGGTPTGGEPTPGGLVIGGKLGGKTTQPTPEPTAEPTPEASTGGSGLVIGGKLGGQLNKGAQPTPAPTDEATIIIITPAPTPEAPTSRLVPFHAFIDDMPYEFDDYSKESQTYTVYFYLDDFAPVSAYRQAFLDAGWTEELEGPDRDGWSYVDLTSPDGKATFYIGYIEIEGVAAFMYDSTADYGFDPVEGL